MIGQTINWYGTMSQKWEQGTVFAEQRIRLNTATVGREMVFLVWRVDGGGNLCLCIPISSFL